MTSTNINVGIPESRNSSRVLKPPGGGHSDIFGIYESQDPQTPKAKNNYPKSSISEVFGSNDSSNHNQKEKQKTEEQIDNQIVNENEVPKPPIIAQQRTRVPPGGFSSGLW